MNCIQQFHAKPGDKFILCCRVSSRQQKYNENAEDQAKYLRWLTKDTGIIILDTIIHVGPGTNPEWLREPAKLARKKHANLLAETLDRYIRSSKYHSKHNPDAQATKKDICRLLKVTRNMTLMTYLHPHAAPKEVRSFQRKRGRWAENSRKRKRGKNLTKQQIRRVLKLRKDGLSYRQIGQKLGMTHSTIQGVVGRTENRVRVY